MATAPLAHISIPIIVPTYTYPTPALMLYPSLPSSFKYLSDASSSMGQLGELVILSTVINVDLFPYSTHRPCTDIST